MASRLAVAAALLLVVVAGVDALRQRSGEEPAPPPPPAQPTPAPASALVGRVPWCRRDTSRSVVVVRCNNWKGYATDQIVLSGSSRELGPR